MRKLRLLSLVLFTFLATMTSCFELGDDILPTPQAPADESYLVGDWKVYKTNSPIAIKDGFYVDARVYIRADHTLTIHRKGQNYEGRWASDRQGYVAFRLNDEASIPEIPGEWSIQRADGDELWLATSIKALYMERYTAPISIGR
jgi:hypothetical protein